MDEDDPYVIISYYTNQRKIPTKDRWYNVLRSGNDVLFFSHNLVEFDKRTGYAKDNRGFEFVLLPRSNKGATINFRNQSYKHSPAFYKYFTRRKEADERRRVLETIHTDYTSYVSMLPRDLINVIGKYN